MRPVGLFGGMFDPIHFGHLRTAHEMHELLRLEQVIFLPAGDPPHRAPPLADAATRLAMLRAAVGDDPHFAVDERELRRSGPSWTILTLEELRAERAEQPLVLILGMDAYAGIGDWHRARELTDYAHIVVALRPLASLPATGFGAELLRDRRCEDPARLADTPAGRVFVCSNTQLDLSSSAVRAVIAAGRDPRYLMPGAARRIILATGIYARPGEPKE
jgi:nicotinate-nucleotide adenylyltransferase